MNRRQSRWVILIAAFAASITLLTGVTMAPQAAGSEVSLVSEMTFTALKDSWVDEQAQTTNHGDDRRDNPLSNRDVCRLVDEHQLSTRS